MKKLILIVLCCISGIFMAVAQKPNVVIIIGDDCTYNDLPVHGGTNVQTPAIDELAKEGMVFDKAYVSMAMCTPCRTELYTGLYPASSDVQWNHSKANNDTKSIVHYFEDMGYRVGLAGKKHVNPFNVVFPFEVIEGVESNPTAGVSNFYPQDMINFITRDPEQPFCMVVAFTTPHAPWTVGDATQFDIRQFDLPDYMVDTEETRENYAKYLAEVTVLDDQTGKTIQILKDQGVYDNTIVIFTSEQGAQFPHSKWTNYENGVHTSLIVKWDGVVTPETRTNALIQYSDILPTLIQAVEGDTTGKGFDGTSFLPVLKGGKTTHRDYAYFMHNNYPEGSPYPIRSITDGSYHYILNLSSDDIYIEKHLMGGTSVDNYWYTWMGNVTDEDNYKLVSGYMYRPEEELFYIPDDKYELNNLLINSPSANEAKRAELSAKLDEWMNTQWSDGNGKPLDSKSEYNKNQNK